MEAFLLLLVSDRWTDESKHPLFLFWVGADVRFPHISARFRCLMLSLTFRGRPDSLRTHPAWPGESPRLPLIGSLSLSLFLTDRCTTERTPHPVSLATTHVRRCWVGSLTVHQTACGWSSTATPPEPIRASASRTPVSCLTNKVFSKRGKSPLFSSVFMPSFEGFFFFPTVAGKQKASLFYPLCFISPPANRGWKCNSLKLNECNQDTWRRSRTQLTYTHPHLKH